MISGMRSRMPPAVQVAVFFTVSIRMWLGVADDQSHPALRQIVPPAERHHQLLGV